MPDKWDTIVEDEALADPLILPADGLIEGDQPGVNETRAEEASAREDTLLAEDADRDLAAQRASTARNRGSRRISPPRGRRTTGG